MGKATVGTIASTSTTTTTRATTTEPKPSGPVHHFHGGVFDGKSYAGDIGVRADATPGTLVLTVMFGQCLEAAFAWRQTSIRWDEHP